MDFQCCLSELAHIQSSDSSTPLPSSFSKVKTKYRTPVNVSENQSARMTQPGAMLSSTWHENSAEAQQPEPTSAMIVSGQGHRGVLMWPPCPDAGPPRGKGSSLLVCHSVLGSCDSSHNCVVSWSPLKPPLPVGHALGRPAHGASSPLR